jgi:hypothetical protein
LRVEAARFSNNFYAGNVMPQLQQRGFTMSTAKREWSTSALATEFGLDRGTVARRLKNVPPASVKRVGGDRADKKWLLKDAAPMLQAKKDPPLNGADPDSKNLAYERQRLIKAQADHEELDYLIKCGKLIDVDMVMDILSNLVALLKSGVQNLGGRLANELLNEHNPAVVKARVDSETNAVLIALAHGAGELKRQLQEARKNAENG